MQIDAPVSGEQDAEPWSHPKVRITTEPSLGLLEPPYDWALSPDFLRIPTSANSSLAGFSLADELITRPPQSDPHHSASVASIVGGDDAVVVDMKTSSFRPSQAD